MSAVIKREMIHCKNGYLVIYFYEYLLLFSLHNLYQCCGCHPEKSADKTWSKQERKKVFFHLSVSFCDLKFIMTFFNKL